MTRLAVVTTHPVQYYAPWFRHLAAAPGVDLRVFYLWDFGVTDRIDPGFGHAVKWDVPLLDGYPHEFVPNRSRRPATNRFRGIDNPDLPARLRAFGPGAVLCIGYNNATFARLLLTWDRRRSPLLLRGDSHRLVPPTGWKAAVRRRVVAAVFRRFAACLYVGQANRDYYKTHDVPDGKLFFAPHAIDNDRFMGEAETTATDAADWKRDLGIPAAAAVVLFVGKFEEKKRPRDLLAGFAAARPPGAVLLFVGAGAQESILRAEAAGVPGVYFAPFQNQSKMPRAYAAGDVLVLPSFGPSETWGLCVNEAMCLGKPAVVSTHVGCGRDMVLPGKTGLVFPAGDVAALAGCLTDALSDRDRLRRWGEAARDHVRGYSYERATAGALDGIGAVTARLAGTNP